MAGQKFFKIMKLIKSQRIYIYIFWVRQVRSWWAWSKSRVEISCPNLKKWAQHSDIGLLWASWPAQLVGVARNLRSKIRNDRHISSRVRWWWAAVGGLFRQLERGPPLLLVDAVKMKILHVHIDSFVALAFDGNSRWWMDICKKCHQLCVCVGGNYESLNPIQNNWLAVIGRRCERVPNWYNWSFWEIQSSRGTRITHQKPGTGSDIAGSLREISYSLRSKQPGLPSNNQKTAWSTSLAYVILLYYMYTRCYRLTYYII